MISIPAAPRDVGNRAKNQSSQSLLIPAWAPQESESELPIPADPGLGSLGNDLPAGAALPSPLAEPGAAQMLGGSALPGMRDEFPSLPACQCQGWIFCKVPSKRTEELVAFPKKLWAGAFSRAPVKVGLIGRDGTARAGLCGGLGVFLKGMCFTWGLEHRGNAPLTGLWGQDENLLPKTYWCFGPRNYPGFWAGLQTLW